MKFSTRPGNSAVVAHSHILSVVPDWQDVGVRPRWSSEETHAVFLSLLLHVLFWFFLSHRCLETVTFLFWFHFLSRCSLSVDFLFLFSKNFSSLFLACRGVFLRSAARRSTNVALCY